jgi:hypothetical protein
MEDIENSFLPPDSEPTEPEAICFELANGHNVKLHAKVWPGQDYEDWISNNPTAPYFAIRIYSTENTNPRRLAYVDEFCEGADFAQHDFEEIWQWLTEFCRSRDVYEFDELEEFIDHVADSLVERFTSDMDAVDHIKHLPEICSPEAFDKVDDSIFNDQNDIGNERGDIKS